MYKKNLWFVLALVAVLVAVMGLVAACGSGTTTTTAVPAETTTTAAAGHPQGGTLAVYIGDPSYIDPTNCFESEGTQVVQAVFDSLTAIDYRTGALIPAAADSWDANADGSVWTFHLHPGATFSDGTPVTAASFKYAWERIANPVNKSEIAYHLAKIKGYDEMQADPPTATALSGLVAKDDLTLEVTLTQAFADFPFVAAHPSLAPLPKAAVEKDPTAWASNPIGNGPFKLSEPWAAGQYVKVVKNDSYYGAKANIAGIDFRIFKDVETAFLEFKAGTLDWTQIPSGQYKATSDQYGIADDGYTGNPGKQVQNGGELAIYYVTINNTDQWFKNADLRKAVSLAINRQALCDTVYEGIRKPASSIVPMGLQGYEENAWADSHYDVEAAKAALTAAGFPGGKGLPTLKLAFNSGAGHEDVMALVQADLKAIGITVEFDTSDAPTFWSKLADAKYEIARCGWSADYPIIDNFLFPLFNSKSGDNYSKYANTAVDTAIDKARTIVDVDARVKAYQDVVKLIGADNPVVPLDTYSHHHVVSERVNNLTYSASNLLDFVSCWITQ